MGSVTACTHETAPPPGPSRTPAASSPAVTAGTPTLHARSVPLRVEVTRVAGTLAPHRRAVLEHRVGRVLHSYVRAAFLAGPYPRTGAGHPFGTFSRAAVRRARSDRALLTSAGLARHARSVVARKERARLSVLAPHRVAAGVTAHVRLLLRVDRTGRRPDARVSLTGRLLLGRSPDGGWQIFGYDLARATVPVGEGGAR